MIKRLGDNASEINACTIIRERSFYRYPYKDYILHLIEMFLSTRLEDETFRGMFNIVKAMNPAEPIEDAKKAFVSLNHSKIKITLNCFYKSSISFVFFLAGLFGRWCVQNTVPW